MGDVTFPFPGLCNLIIRQFESWKLTSTGITRVPNHCISFFQTPLSRKAKPSPCEYLACLFITALYCLVCSLVGLNHHFCWCNETLFFFIFFFYHLLQLLHASGQFLSPLPWRAAEDLPSISKKNRYVIN